MLTPLWNVNTCISKIKTVNEPDHGAKEHSCKGSWAIPVDRLACSNGIQNYFFNQGYSIDRVVTKGFLCFDCCKVIYSTTTHKFSC